jgi:hypothetical protein
MSRLRKHSKAEKSLLIKKWVLSGQSRSIFAQSHGLKYDTFKKWIQSESAIKDKGINTITTNRPLSNKKDNTILKDAAPFVSLQIDHASPTTPITPVLEIRLSNGTHLQFYEQVDAQYLRTLLQ